MSLIKHLKNTPQFIIIEAISSAKEEALEDRLFKNYIKHIQKNSKPFDSGMGADTGSSFYDYITNKAEELNISLRNAVDKYMSQITTSDLLDTILSCDPTDNKKYGNWLVDNIIDWFDRSYIHSFKEINDIVKEESGKIKRNLRVFTLLKDRNKLSGSEADINQYDFIELFKLVKPYLDDPDFLGTNKEVIMNESDIIYDNNGWKIVKPQTHRASCVWGSGTNWCTAVDDGDSRTFDQYTEDEDLYIFIREKSNTKEKFQMHWDSRGLEFRNASDEIALFEFHDLMGDDLFFDLLGVCVFDMDTKSQSDVIEFLYNLDTFCGDLKKLQFSKKYEWHNFMPYEAQKTIVNILTIQANGKDTLKRYSQSKDILKALIDTNEDDVDTLLGYILNEVGTSIVIDMIETVEDKQLLKDLENSVIKYYKDLMK